MRHCTLAGVVLATMASHVEYQCYNDTKILIHLYQLSLLGFAHSRQSIAHCRLANTVEFACPNPRCALQLRAPRFATAVRPRTSPPSSPARLQPGTQSWNNPFVRVRGSLCSGYATEARICYQHLLLSVARRLVLRTCVPAHVRKCAQVRCGECSTTTHLRGGGDERVGYGCACGPRPRLATRSQAPTAARVPRPLNARQCKAGGSVGTPLPERMLNAVPRCRVLVIRALRFRSSCRHDAWFASSVERWCRQRKLKGRAVFSRYIRFAFADSQFPQTENSRFW